jgi:O-acetylserine/cysteine efflux transporter
MKPVDLVFAVMVAVVWGLAFVASRIALNELSPSLMTALRFAVTALPCLAVRRPFALLVPFVGAAASSVAFGEKLGPLRLGGMITAVCGIAIMLLSRRPQAIPKIA